MTVNLNKKSIEIEESESLTALLDRCGVSTKGIAVAVDRRLVPRSQWSDFMLTDGMDIIVVNATCGG